MNSVSAPMTAGDGSAGKVAPSLWLGYAPGGGRVSLGYGDMKGRLLITGHSADDMASLVAYTASELGLKVLVLDLDGRFSERVSGYFQTYDYTCFLHDAFELEEEDGVRHCQLIAAAYTVTMDLTSEEESIMNAAMQKLMVQDTRASPAVMFEVTATVEGFRGFYVEKLQGRLAALKYLESPENGSVRSLLSLGSCIVNFGSASYPQAAELAAAVFIAKLLTMIRNSRTKPDMIVVNDVHRLFRAEPRPSHLSRLMNELLDAPVTVVLASDRKRALSGSIQDAIPVKLLSSDAWNDGFETRWKGKSREPVLPNTCVIVDGHYGNHRTFIPRAYERKTSEPRKGPGVLAPAKAPDNELTRLILEDVRRFEAATRTSIIEFLSGEYGEEGVRKELDRLHAQGLIEFDSESPRTRDDGMLVYRLTDAGARLLEVLS